MFQLWKKSISSWSPLFWVSFVCQFYGLVLWASFVGQLWFGIVLVWVIFVRDYFVILNLHIKADCEIFKYVLVHECLHSRFWLLVNWFLYWSWLDRYNDRWSNNWLSWWFVSWKMSLRDLVSFESEHIPYNTSCHPFNIVICHFFCFTINILY